MKYYLFEQIFFLPRFPTKIGGYDLSGQPLTYLYRFYHKTLNGPERQIKLGSTGCPPILFQSARTQVSVERRLHASGSHDVGSRDPNPGAAWRPFERVERDRNRLNLVPQQTAGPSVHIQNG